ncbi:MAG: hypothetical protein Q9216_006209 [Gyalolechia sp. 2 TL-2023]
MRLSTCFSSLLCALIALILLPAVQGRPRALSKQERIASILAQKPMHTTALLAGAAMPTPSPYPPHASDLGYTERPPPCEDDTADLDDDDDDGFDDDDDESDEYLLQIQLKR